MVTHPLLIALGIDAIPEGSTEESLVKKVLQDNLFFNRGTQALLEQQAASIITSRYSEAERKHLRDKLAPRVDAKISWSVSQGLLSGFWYIQGSCSRCRAAFIYDGRPDRMGTRLWTHCQVNEVPAHILEQYAKHFAEAPHAMLTSEAYRAALQPRQETYSEMTERLDKK